MLCHVQVQPQIHESSNIRIKTYQKDLNIVLMFSSGNLQ